MINTKEILNVLPLNLRQHVEPRLKIERLQEIRVKVSKPIILQIGNEEVICSYIANEDDVKEIIQRISNYSLYAFEEEIRQGYITIRGGHRVGICGDCVIDNLKIKTIKNIASVNFRINRQVIGCSDKLMPYLMKNNDILNTIIISPPRCGKTTLLRDISRNISHGLSHIGLLGKKVTIIDERSEIAACHNGVPQMDVGLRTDVYDNCPKSEGIMMAIRSMSPEVILCDEIGTNKDMESIIMALNCGINLITSIHGFGIEDLYNRMVFKDILDNNVFKRAVVLSCSKGVGTIEYIYDFATHETVWRK
jgi:stage III sporulation protein AA